MRITTVLLILLCLVSPLVAQDASQVGTEITIELVNGDILTGTLVEITADTITIDHPFGGLITVDRSSVVPPEPPPPPEEAEEAEVAEAEVSAPWTGNINAALNGRTGNNEETNFRGEATTRRESDTNVDWASVVYQKNRSRDRDEGERHKRTTLDRAFWQARREWKLEDTKWRPFAYASWEDDEDKNYNYRLRVNLGGAYPWIDDKDADGASMERWIGRVGMAASKTFNGDDDGWAPEAALGMEYFRQITATTDLFFNTDVYPSLEGGNQGEWQSVTDLKVNIKADPESPWSFNSGIQHLYNSDPDDGDRSRDVFYYAGVGYVF